MLIGLCLEKEGENIQGRKHPAPRVARVQVPNDKELKSCQEKKESPFLRASTDLVRNAPIILTLGVVSRQRSKAVTSACFGLVGWPGN